MFPACQLTIVKTLFSTTIQQLAHAIVDCFISVSNPKGESNATCFFQIDPAFQPQELETRTIYGLQLEQLRNNAKIDENVFRNIKTKRQDVSQRETNLHNHVPVHSPYLNNLTVIDSLHLI